MTVLATYPSGTGAPFDLFGATRFFSVSSVTESAAICNTFAVSSSFASPCRSTWLSCFTILISSSCVIILLVEIFWSKIYPVGCCILPRRGKANFAGGSLMLAAAPKCLPLLFPKSSARYSSRRCAARCFSGVFSIDISPCGFCILPYLFP